MKKLLSVLLVLAVLSAPLAHAEDIRYEYDRIVVSFSFEYMISVGDSEKAGWIAEIMGDSDSLQMVFTQAELYNSQAVGNPNGVNIINIIGQRGARTFLSNGIRVTDRQTLEFQLWSGITMDGLDVVKDYSKPLEIVYLDFRFSSDKTVSGVNTSFFAEDIDQNRDESGRFKGVYYQIGNTKATDFRDVNYTGDLSTFLVQDWGINWAMISNAPTQEFPAENNEPSVDNEKEISPSDRIKTADKLKELTLFMGTNTGYALDKTLTRAQAATILVRLLGEESSVLQTDYANNPFADVPDNHWAKNYILYCYENGITKGTSATTYSPERAISSKEFLTLVMRLMGYESEPVSSLDDCVKATLFGSDYATRLRASDTFFRGDVVDIMDKSLITPINTDSEPVLLVEELVEKEVFTREQAIEAQLLPNPEEDILKQINGIAGNKLSS